eukprot:9733232-Ditylum_brightwellii.AAC.1
MTQSPDMNATIFLDTPKPVAQEIAESLAKTPCIPPLEKPPPEEKHETTIHKFHVKVAFTVSELEDICPRAKFATLLSLIIQQYLYTILQPWNHEERGCVITAGEDLPYEKEQLSIFCPHKQRNGRLSTQWNLQCDTCFYFLKSNRHILEHIH